MCRDDVYLVSGSRGGDGAGFEEFVLRRFEERGELLGAVRETGAGVA
jgi:hypothetical protein